MESISWKLIDKYFKDNPDNLVSHHLESYNDFFKNGIKRIFHENNPIRFIEREDESIDNEKRNECQLYLGGKDGIKIYYGKPIIYDDHNSHFMFPNDARLRNMTYGITIHYDVEVDFLYYIEGEKKQHSIILPKVYLGRFPIMLQSDLCILNTLNKNKLMNDKKELEGSNKCITYRIAKHYRKIEEVNQDNNKETVKQYKKKYRDNNKEKKRQETSCECGKTYQICSKARHLRSIKHCQFFESQTKLIQ
jgi:hypothetical protein